jgi:hypothetical protein
VWQKRQVIHAIQLLFKTIRSPVYQSIDWEYWKSSALALVEDMIHTTETSFLYRVKQLSIKWRKVQILINVFTQPLPIHPLLLKDSIAALAPKGLV